MIRGAALKIKSSSDASVATGSQQHRAGSVGHRTQIKNGPRKRLGTSHGPERGICDAKAITTDRTVRAAICLGSRATFVGGELRSAAVAHFLACRRIGADDGLA